MSSSEGPANKGVISGVITFTNLGLSIMTAASGALAVKNAGSDAGVGFVGLYLILFSAILFTYEAIQIRPCEALDNIYKRNFGFLYGMNGKCIYILFIAILSYGQSNIENNESASLNTATSVLLTAWGVLLWGLSCMYPDYFDKKEKYDPTNDFR